MNAPKMNAPYTREFSEALRRAHRQDIDPLTEEPYPKPLCDGRADEFVLYDLPPHPEVARQMCAPCPLLDKCSANAKRVRPAWGVHAGKAWNAGRRAWNFAESDDDLDSAA